MVELRKKFSGFFNSRWLVFVAATWTQSCGGIGYLFGSISPVIKSSMNYNQKQIATLGVAKDIGDCMGFLAGGLSEVWPLWGVLLLGALQVFIGYGWIWLVVTHQVPSLPLWALCALIFIGTNCDTYFNTAALVSCVQNFPKSRGPIVGILKGFNGLSGAILTQIYVLISSPDHASLIFMVAVGPSMVVISLMFIIRPVGGHKQTHPSDGFNFSFVYSICLLMAAYLMGVLVVQDLMEVSHKVIVAFTVILFVLLLLPICIPISMCMLNEPPGSLTEVEPIVESEKSEIEVVFSEIEDENLSEVDLLFASERQKRTAQLQARIAQAAAEGAVRVKRKKGPRRGEDFTLRQALVKADFWLIFISLVLAAGSGLTVIDNLGQMSQSLGYDNAHIFVSMISIWNFLGRVGGGYFSEIVVRVHAYPRPAAMAVAQAVMVGGHLFIGMGWPGALYVGTLFIGLGYGAHWAIVPATASELFGLKNFGALYNFLTLGNPAGSLIFSGVIASGIYDYEAEKQANDRHQIPTGLILSKGMAALNEPLKCEGAICFFFTSMIMASFCIIAVVLSTILVHRTKVVYAHLYGKAGV